MNSLKLQKKIETFIYNPYFDDKILAMKMLSYLRNHSCDDQIIKYSQSINFALRTEAYASLIRLMDKDEHLVNFIGNKHILSILDINIIVNTVLKNHKMGIDYQALLSSGNHRKIMIGLLLAKYRYRRNKNNIVLIINHIGSADSGLNKMAWEAMLSLVPEDDLVDIIIDRFEKEPDEIKILILEKMNNAINERFFNFLKDIIAHQKLLVKIEAMKIIFKNDFNSFLVFENSQNEEIAMAYNEVSSIYIY